MNGLTRNDELFIVLFVERAARMAEALGPACEAGEAGLSGAVARAICDGHLTVTPELAREARRWRLRQAGQEEEDETEDELADRRALEEQEIQEPAALEEEEDLTPEPLEAPVEIEASPPPTLDSPEMREAVTTAAAALGALFGAVGAPVEPATPEAVEAPPKVDEDTARVQAMIDAARARSRQRSRQAKEEPPLSDLAQRALAQLSDLTLDGVPVRSREMATHCACRKAEMEAALKELEERGKVEPRGEGWVTAGAPTETVRIRDGRDLVAVLEVERNGALKTYLDPKTGQVWDSLHAARRDLLAREVG